MLRMTRLTDYGILVLAHLASAPFEHRFTTRELAEKSGLPLCTVVKILKALAGAGLLLSWRGPSGGYQLSRAPGSISLRVIIRALEGPIEVAPGVSRSADGASLGGCNWQLVNDALCSTLDGISLLDVLRGSPVASSMMTIGANRVSGKEA